MVAALVGLLLAPVAGAAGGWSAIGRRVRVAMTLVFLSSAALLMISWRAIPGGIAAAASGHAAFLVSAACLVAWGRVGRPSVGSELTTGLTGLLAATALTIGPFALGPLMSDLPLGAYNWMLLANPLVTVSSAAGIDLLHLDLLYRLSPLAHRGVALPAWTTACSGYAVLGLAGYGVSHLRHRSA